MSERTQASIPIPDLNADIAAAVQRYNASCARDSAADAAWLDFAGEDLDQFQDACVRLARVCELTCREAALVMFATLEDRWQFKGGGDTVPTPSDM